VKVISVGMHVERLVREHRSRSLVQEHDGAGFAHDLAALRRLRELTGSEEAFA